MGGRFCPEKCTCKRHHRCLCNTEGIDKCPHHNLVSRKKWSEESKTNPRGFALWSKEKLVELGKKGYGGNVSKPCSVRTMTEIERAWLGAMVEAEGCVGYYNKYWRINIVNTDLEIVSTALRLTQVGNITKHKGENKICWVWAVERKNDVMNLSKQLNTYCMKTRKIKI